MISQTEPSILVMRDCLVHGNTASTTGGIRVQQSPTTITNCTVTFNTSTLPGQSGGGLVGGTNTTIVNSIFWGNTDNDSGSTPEDEQITGAVTVTFSDIQGLDVFGSQQGNIGSDPELVSQDPNHRVYVSSPCIEAGDPNFVPQPGETDLIGNPRVYDADANGTAVVDMGAFESQRLVIAKPTAPSPSSEDGFTKNRYLSVIPGNSGIQTALRVTFTTLPGFPTFEGTAEWIDAPADVSENSGYADASYPPTFKASTLQCDAHYQDWGAISVLHISGDDIVPSSLSSTATYSVQAIDSAGDTSEESHFSAPLVVTTSRWCDVAGSFSAPLQQWTAPDGIVSITMDLLAVQEKYSNDSTAPIKARADLATSIPDRIVNIIEILKVQQAFGGGTYPPTSNWGPSACP